MEDFQKKVIKDADNLHRKMVKTRNFMFSDKAITLTEIEKSHLMAQLQSMQQLYNAYNYRINDFKVQEKAT